MTMWSNSLAKCAVWLIIAIGILGCGGGGESNPAPVINSISPSTANAGTQTQNVTINGSGFLASSTATYNGTAAQATFVSSSQLTLALTTGNLSTVGAFPIVVTNPPPGGGPSN